MEKITWDDFEKIEMRIGTIVDVQEFPEARTAAYRLIIDFGIEIGLKKSSAQITKKYNTTDLVGKQIVAVLNFPKKQIATFISECLVMGSLGTHNEVVLLSPDMKVENGLRIG